MCSPPAPRKMTESKQMNPAAERTPLIITLGSARHSHVRSRASPGQPPHTQIHRAVEWDKPIAQPGAAEERRTTGVPELFNARIPMAGTQRWHSKPGIEGALHGNPSLQTRGSPPGVCDTSGNNNEQMQLDSRPDYVKQMYSVFGPEVAEYFLNPPPLEIRTRPEIQQLIEALEGSLTAERLWSTIREESRRKLLEISTPVDQALILDCLRHNQQMSKGAKKRHLLRLIQRIAQLQEDMTSVLIANNTVPGLCESCGNEGPAKYFLAGS